MMRAFDFDSALLPPEARLSAFRQGASHFAVDPVGDPRAFHTRWRLLKLGDVNVIRSITSPIHYQRDHALIEADGQDRVAIHYRIAGAASGTLDNRVLNSGPGSAAVWDLAHTLDFKAFDISELIIVTLPRYMLDEIFAVTSYSCVVPKSSELALAAVQVRYLLEHSEDITEEGGPALGRAVRDLFAVALMPELQRLASNPNTDAESVLQRINRAIDTQLRVDLQVDELAHQLSLTADSVRDIADRAGGLDMMVERRRLLAAFQRLSDPVDVTPLALVAWQCGMNDLQRFRRRFRALFSVTPNQLRAGVPGHLPNWAGAYQVDMSYGAFLRRDG
ncbi:helix-turn-helix domain-containing protein [Sphingomonas sp. PsM26]|jgi:AraC-like DNA-binding protein|nr:helix-turn-helix domain-containing protein [Sphingomonas sp. PsM26]